MSNTSDQTTKPSKETRLIVGEVGVDTETGIVGKGHSYDNGKTFVVDDTIYGRVYHADDHGKIWKGIEDQVAKVVAPAKSAADSAVAYTNDAIEKSRVNSQAIVDINSAVSEAVSDAAVARSDGLRAWDAARSNVNLIDSNYASASASISSARTETIAAADEAKASASAAQAGVVAVKSDVEVQAKSLSSYAAQASANGADIVTLKSQAGQFEQDMASVKGDVSQLKVSASSASVALSDATGNISSLQATAKSYSAALSDTNSNVASVTATASELDAKYADAAGDINTLKADASGFSQTLTDAKGDISTLQSTATGLKNTLTDAQGNISTLQSDVSGLKKTTSDNAGNIATLQANAQTLTSQMSGAQGDISTLKQTASGISSQVTVLSDKAMQNRGTVDSPDFNSLTQAGYYTITSPSNGKNYPIGSWGTLEVSGQVTDNNGRLNQKYVSDNNGTAYTRQYNANTKGWTAWVKVANQNDIDTLNGKITANTTAINQNKNAISLKADQTAVDTINGTVSQLQSSLTVQAGQIQEKVTSSQVTGMLTGYATQTYTQSLITQKANEWNLNLTNLKTDVNAIKTTGGGVNLLTNTDKDISVTSHTTDGWPAWDNIDTGFSFEHGKTYTFSVEANNSNNNITEASIRVWESSTNTQVGIYAFPADGNRHSVTFTIPNDSHNYHLLLYAGHAGIIPGVNVTTTYHHPNLEFGTVAHDWSPAPSDMATVTSVTNLSATVDGIKGTVATKADQSTVTELSNLIQTKVSSGDYNSQITQLKNLINQRVQVGDVISQINQEAGGNTLIQVSNGKGSLILNADNTIMTGKAWIPVAAIADLTADDITTGTLKGVDIDFRNSSGQGVLIKDSTVTFDDGSSGDKAGYLSFSSMPISDWPSGAGGNELQIRYGESLAIVATSDTNSRALFSTANTQIGYHQQGNSSSDWGLTGLKIDNSARHFNLGVWATDSTWARVEATPHNIQMQANDAHAWLYNNNFHIYRDNDGGSATATELQVDGWAWVRGWVEAAGHSQHSALSTKTDIQPVDDDKMLKMVNDTDLTTFLYKTDVASGETHRHIGLIIDDVHDVAQYQAPQDFIAPNGVSRDDDNMIGALFGAVKALTKRIKALESKAG